ncbi:hypothetical protein P153DRAFT_396178 [Dothidotthia symphoricarpi CBS 119687]|uniref:Uncharacterized protein n=1 Tax=Dothidotthia symphoricarpi CBS 119687 TaxID=1392245 RepID=A0A6A6ADI4_9PLEO|nr:uncharacterized protein P153DRAFT_396178 [Dothidotthia symphoricarpi CBS 119687]KAF2129840.1 hypothetical protein P153DRAFT_396178 [Dothidotthia symphoricarpi CBS 119687]
MDGGDHEVARATTAASCTHSPRCIPPSVLLPVREEDLVTRNKQRFSEVCRQGHRCSLCKLELPVHFFQATRMKGKINSQPYYTAAGKTARWDEDLLKRNDADEKAVVARTPHSGHFIQAFNQVSRWFAVLKEQTSQCHYANASWGGLNDIVEWWNSVSVVQAAGRWPPFKTRAYLREFEVEGAVLWRDLDSHIGWAPHWVV